MAGGVAEEQDEEETAAEDTFPLLEPTQPIDINDEDDNDDNDDDGDDDNDHIDGAHAQFTIRANSVRLQRRRQHTKSNGYQRLRYRQLLQGRKLLIWLACLALIGIVYANVKLDSRWYDGDPDLNEVIPVRHYSHVHGMRVFKNTTTTTTTTTTVATTMAIKTTIQNKTKKLLKNSQDFSQSMNQYNLYKLSSYALENSENNLKNSKTNADYLVWSEQCQIPNLDPYLPEVMRHFHRQTYKPCSTTPEPVQLEYNETMERYVLSTDLKIATKHYAVKSGIFSCCYQTIERNGDAKFSVSACMDFKERVVLPNHINNIFVKCKSKKWEVFSNGYALMPLRDDVRERLDAWRNETPALDMPPAPNVLMIGIDSISRTNLIRAMPKTAQYLYDNEWFELSGYNKVDDNTYPNLMAVLTGSNHTTAYDRCKPYTVGGLDNCTFIWDLYRENGYVTAYAEDVPSINTFNYLKKGFVQSPVDYYMRPFLLLMEKKFASKSRFHGCLGMRNAAELVYDYAMQMVRRFKSQPYFGLFWTNTFSHDAISTCSFLDKMMIGYLKQLVTLNNTVVVFFSDHGMRFGPTRGTYSGHLEERLPFIFLWLPKWLKQQYPEFVSALSINRNRLTNPYDLHETLKHLLVLSGRVDGSELLGRNTDCKRAQSLLLPVPHNRSCEETCIPEHWCTCTTYKSIPRTTQLLPELAKRTVKYINKFIGEFRNGAIKKLCVPLSYSHIDSAYKAQSASELYRVIFYTKPNKALYEATLRYNSSTTEMLITGEISRLNSYSGDSDCIQDSAAKKYCSCHKKKRH